MTDAITQIVALCKEQAVPTVFALSRRRLAVILKKKHKIGCVGIFSYDGAEVGVWSRCNNDVMCCKSMLM